MKNSKTENQEVKNPMDYGYTGEEVITISAREFIALKNAVEGGINATIETFMPEVLEYVSTETSKTVEKPSPEDIASGKVVLVSNRRATFSQENVRLQYNTSKITREMVQGQELVLDIHDRNVNNGVATHRDQLAELAKK